ncbi:hypothetical protein B9Z55_013280 [Caenorhabditis nigoni]|uniref:7TM GPCR serpentine receptor class x (Srx) domain-containing protein n=1 Tax=Caenorhabditis nigoni TaxID=1611254 RepID=A0A2G5U198_9PELO|nr:hypothetical protein B9Z55_013280 [Caenorhabditis nigoni]
MFSISRQTFVISKTFDIFHRRRDIFGLYLFIVALSSRGFLESLVLSASFPRHVIFCFGFAIQPAYNVYYVLSLILGMLFQMISKEIRDRLIEFESENCDVSYIARQKDFEINELTIAANDLRGNMCFF